MSAKLSIRRRDGRRGNALIEFTLVGLPLLFILISIFECARGMWLYTTLQHATKDTVRFAIVHGANCGVNGNSCQTSVSQVVTQFNRQAPMFDASRVQMELRSGCRSQRKFDQDSCRSVLTGTLQSMLANGTVWPDEADPGVDSIEIYARVPFDSVISLFWPTSGTVGRFGQFNLQAISRETVQF